MNVVCLCMQHAALYFLVTVVCVSLSAAVKVRNAVYHVHLNKFIL